MKFTIKKHKFVTFQFFFSKQVSMLFNVVCITNKKSSYPSQPSKCNCLNFQIHCTISRHKEFLISPRFCVYFIFHFPKIFIFFIDIDCRDTTNNKSLIAEGFTSKQLAKSTKISDFLFPQHCFIFCPKYTHNHTHIHKWLKEQKM